MSSAVLANDRAHMPKGSVECTSEYILVCDLPQRIRSLRLSGLKVPGENDPIFEQIHDGLTRLLTQALPGSHLRVMDMRDLSENILAKAHNLVARMDNAFIVSSCTEIANPAHGATLEVNRIIDIEGNILESGIITDGGDLFEILHPLLSVSQLKSFFCHDKEEQLVRVANLFKEVGALDELRSRNFKAAEFLRILANKRVLHGTARSSLKNIGRNTLCPCGSGKKYKRCCGK